MTNAEPLAPELETIVANAAAASDAYAAVNPVERAKALVAVADALDASREELVSIAASETGLTEARLNGELTRTAVQLRLFADVAVDGGYLDVRIDEADTAFALGVRPDLRRYHIPVGPVLNFSASNFPFAFSVAGGDSAAALAAGCPVIVKAHSGHPQLSIRTAEVVAEALAGAGMPDGVFQLIAGQAAGIAVLKDARIKAGSFTGSIYAGRLLADIAASRPAPIRFYGELGSVNPVFVTKAAIDEQAAELAAGYVTSVAGSAGQLCTKPGFVFVPEAHGLDEAIASAAAPVGEHRLLNQKIAKSYVERRDAIIGTAGVRVVAEGGIRIDDEGHGWATPTIVAVSLDNLRAGRETLMDEVFGPMSVLVEYPAGADLAAAVPELFEGNLTATLHLGTVESAGEGADVEALRDLIRVLTQHAGRVLFGGWPTGVAVTPAMQHGGPWPATSNDSSTSVGTAAISRFLRPVAYQSAPDALLPEPLRTSNPWNVPQAIAPAGESTQWGSSAK
ncbi:aldehyde dehydrogenase (NADP(+)) [Lysinibacter cavernae]|uniref:NADP-dependent aldehyde dehydrogenase n=1 Tax=Lysinibacter cavernae TaxID=1640652 RepID=A0A7X5R3X9_9MICO|nr:aldehyde dehydrogenase (NADP(+)) [Lysinibacter cavernae]NIH54902.1 NADP-dependent aldehyde dehydrogenase [Lysinibacter cavernae]